MLYLWLYHFLRKAKFHYLTSQNMCLYKFKKKFVISIWFLNIFITVLWNTEYQLFSQTLSPSSYVRCFKYLKMRMLCQIYFPKSSLLRFYLLSLELIHACFLYCGFVSPFNLRLATWVSLNNDMLVVIAHTNIYK